VVDIEAFFPSVTVGRVEQALYHAGIEPELVETLAAICTRAGTLPQGAPTSPAIASLMLGDVDRLVFDASKADGCDTTRYADDWGVSGDDRHAVERVVGIIALGVERVGLKLNPAKSRVRSQRHPMIYLGLNVAHGRLSVPEPYRARLDSEVHRAHRYGADAKTLARLRGQAQYVRRFHPGEGGRLVERLNQTPGGRGTPPCR
jgi:RNA-directed DNA polymerase